jgi:replication-associated recombination protein RarA
MSLFATPLAGQPQHLTEKYRPLRIADFVGISEAKDICEGILLDGPEYPGYIFVGEPGMGKTALAMALAAELNAQLHHIPSQECNLDRLKAVTHACHYIPAPGCTCHLVLVDEADEMTAAAQLFMLSKLDSTGSIPNTIFIFTCNATDGLHRRFLQRCCTVNFSSYGNAKDAAALIERIWQTEAPANADTPNFARIVKDSNGNVRGCVSAIGKLITRARTQARRADAPASAGISTPLFA